MEPRPLAGLKSPPHQPIHVTVIHRASTGVLVGVAGLVLAVGAVVTGQTWLAGAAGGAALLAGLLTLGLSDRLRRSRAEASEAATRAARAEDESDAMAARAARFEADARRVGGVPANGGDRDAPPVPARGLDLGRVTDEETGLFNTAFFAVTLDKRVSASRRGLRPLALGLLEPVTGLEDDDPTLHLDHDVAEVLLATLRDSDIACRLEDGLVALILEDTPENGAVWTVERVRRRLSDRGDGISLRAGIACYPAHAFDAQQLLGAARTALGSARDWHQDRIEVALVPDD